MMFDTVAESYNNIMNDYSDDRVKDWFLMSNPLPTIFLSLLYIFLVKVLGPRLMRDRKPFQLRKTLIIYNLLQVLFSAWIFWHGRDNVWNRAFSPRCQPVDYSTSPINMKILGGFWWFYFSKFTEFFDTFFFVMRKKYDQISTMHVIHHGIMPLSTWLGVKCAPGGDTMFISNLNTFVHMFMYTYYMLVTVGPHMQKYLWWKECLTVIQLIQFVMMFYNALKLLLMGCDYPYLGCYLIMFETSLFFYLFCNTYQSCFAENISEKTTAIYKKTDDVEEHVKNNTDSMKPSSANDQTI